MTPEFDWFVPTRMLEKISPLTQAINPLTQALNPRSFLINHQIHGVVNPISMGTCLFSILVYGGVNYFATRAISHCSGKGNPDEVGQAAFIHSFVMGLGSLGVLGALRLSSELPSMPTIGALYVITELVGYQMAKSMSSGEKLKFSDLAVNKIALRALLLGFGYGIAALNQL